MPPKPLSVILTVDALGQRIITINDALFVVSEWSDRTERGGDLTFQALPVEKGVWLEMYAALLAWVGRNVVDEERAGYALHKKSGCATVAQWKIPQH